MTDRPTKKFLCSYFHDGSWWSLTIDAYDMEDAEWRVQKLGNLRLDGEVILTVRGYPGVAFIGDLVCKVRNFFFSNT